VPRTFTQRWRTKTIRRQHTRSNWYRRVWFTHLRDRWWTILGSRPSGICIAQTTW